MPTLYNVSTREPEELDGDALQVALAKGTHSYEKGAYVRVTSPDGAQGEVPAGNIQQALSQGYSVETPTQANVRGAVEDFKSNNPGILGPLKVAASQFADEALMGLPELIYNKTADPLDVAKKEAIKKENNLANDIGGIGGGITSLLVGGPLFKGAAKAGESVASHIAEKLAVTAGEELGKRTVSEVAKDIAKRALAKTAGGAIEGSIISLPHAVTETVLGDPGDAAESLLAGGAIGGVLGGGGALVKDLFKLGVTGATKAASFIGEQQPTVEAGARKLAKVFTGVPEQDLKYYVENAERLQAGAPLAPEIEDAIHAARGKVEENLSVAEAAFQNAKKQADEAYGFARQDLAKTHAPEAVADDIMVSLDKQKQVLGEMSERADQALVDSGATFQKKDLLNFIDKIGSSVGAGKSKALIGDEAVGAVGKLKAIRDRIEGGLEDTIDATTLRDVMRQVRKDINWNTSAGEFNDTLNKLKKSFTENISEVLKGKSNEYAEQMAQMKTLSDTVEQMSKTFGDKPKAVSALNGLRSATGKLKRDLLDTYGKVTGEDFTARLEDFNRAKDLLEESRVKDVRDKLIPGLHGKTLDAEKTLMEARDAYDKVKRISQNRTQSVVSRGGFASASREDKKALELLGQKAGTDFNQMIQDRHVLDSFSKDRTQGSRKVNLLSILGGGIGAAVGGAPGAMVGASIGASAGAALDPYGGVLAKKIIDASPKVAGLLFVEQAMKKTAEKLDTIPDILSRMSEKIPGAKPQGIGIYSLQKVLNKDFIPKEKSGYETNKEKVEHIKKINDKISNVVANPQTGSAVLASLSSGISDNGAPNIGAAFSSKLAQTMGYLDAQIPKPQNPTSPFAPQLTYKPSDAQISAFEQKLAVVHDPFVVLHELEQNTLTKNHMDALKAVYPYIYSQIQKKVQMSVIKGVKPLPYQQRVKLSLLMDAPMDTSLNNSSVQFYQQLSAMAPQPAMDKSKSASVNLSNQTMSEAQRLQG